MIDLLIMFGGVAERRLSSGPADFDDSQDCLTYLENRMDEEHLSRLKCRCPGCVGQPAVWRSL